MPGRCSASSPGSAAVRRVSMWSPAAPVLQIPDGCPAARCHTFSGVHAVPDVAVEEAAAPPADAGRDPASVSQARGMVVASLLYLAAATALMIWRRIGVTPDYLLLLLVPVA